MKAWKFFGRTEGAYPEAESGWHPGGSAFVAPHLSSSRFGSLNQDKTDHAKGGSPGLGLQGSGDAYWCANSLDVLPDLNELPSENLFQQSAEKILYFS